MIKRKNAIILLCFVLTGCIATRERMTIPDYIILRNGKEIPGNKGLNAFLFENTQNNFYFQKFLTAKFNLDNLQQKDFWVTIDGMKYKMLVYDNAELEKYFQVSDFIVTNQQPEIEETASRPKFIAISMISSTNEDCLAENSLLRNIATKFLKNLKDDYLKL
jgi:hypothetical protein